MKRRFFLFIVFLSTILNVNAQNDAVYVYRSDGLINAFLKSDIDSIKNSCIEIDSTVCNHYVVQEFWTRDSIYRIPIEDIDSVSFVTPPTIYKDDAVSINGNMQNYIIRVDSLTLLFKKETPKSILPKVNDKLVLMEITDIFPHGFLGQVSDVQTIQDTIFVSCNSLGLTDVFDQYYSYYTINSENSSQSHTRANRVQDTSDRRQWGPATYSPEPAHLVLTPLISPDIYPDPNGDFSFNVIPRYEQEIAPTYTGSAFLIVSPTMGVCFNLNLKEEYKYTTTFNLSGKVDLTKDFQGVHYPVFLPIPLLAIYGEVGAFFRAEASGSIMHEHTQTLRNTLNVEINSHNLYIPRVSYNNVELPSSNKTEVMVDGSIGVGIYAELGLEFFDKNFTNMGFRGEAGIKLGGNAVLYKKDSEKAFHSTEVYNNLLNTDIHLNWFYSVGSQAKFLWFGASHNFKGLSNEGTIVKACPVPTFSNTKIEREQDSPTTLFASTKVSGFTLPVDLGFTIFEGKLSEGISEKGDVSYSAYGYVGPKTELYSSYFDMKPTGSYTVYPTVKLWNVEMLAEPKAELEMFCPDDLHPHMIDLGCGKKWSCCNVGANSPEEYGTYFSWGETYPKNSYTKDTYSLRSVEDGKEYYQLMGSSSEGISGTQYDAATMNWGSIWATPQNSDYNALLSNCQFELYNYNGVSGVRVLGPSGNSIFLPAAGCKEGSSLYGAGTNGYYWSSSWPINENGLVIGAAGPTMYYDSTQIGLDLFYRYYGFSVRPVSR